MMKIEKLLFVLAILAFVTLVVFTGVSVVTAIYGALMALDAGTWTFDTGKQIFHAVCWCFGSVISLWVLWTWGMTIWWRRSLR